MTFVEQLELWPEKRIRDLIDKARPDDVDRAIASDDRSLMDLTALLSSHAENKLEKIAQEAQRLTRWHFGRTISLYVPIYLSNICSSDCLYCGFAVKSGYNEKRITLDMDTIRKECVSLVGHGFESVLLVTGDAPNAVSIDYISEAVSIAREYFSSVCVEIYALDEADYKRLFQCGLEGVTLYMETYNREIYSQVHLKGKKRDYDYRLNALERAGNAGVRKLSLGVLLGLSDWRVDVFRLALHARYLQKKVWQSTVSVSFPRLRHVPERFEIPQLVSDSNLVQLMLALRLFLPEAGFNLSTRENAEFRDHLIPLGITAMSAGSSTRPGGYATCGDETLEQFEIEDLRSPGEVAKAIRKAGYDPVWKDFDLAFDDVSHESDA